jgi:hypothetical protein
MCAYKNWAPLADLASLARDFDLKEFPDLLVDGTTPELCPW